MDSFLRICCSASSKCTPRTLPSAAFPHQVGIWIALSRPLLSGILCASNVLVWLDWLAYSGYMSEGIIISETSSDAVLILHSNSSTGWQLLPSRTFCFSNFCCVLISGFVCWWHSAIDAESTAATATLLACMQATIWCEATEVVLCLMVWVQHSNLCYYDISLHGTCTGLQ